MTGRSSPPAAAAERSPSARRSTRWHRAGARRSPGLRAVASIAVRTLRLRELLFALAMVAALSGVVGMHHVLASPAATVPVTAAPTHAAATTLHTPAHAPAAIPTDDHDDHSGADLLHLCLAVLGAALGVPVVLLVLVALRGRTPVASSAGGAAARALTPRAPPLPVPRRLALLCVLRT